MIRVVRTNMFLAAKYVGTQFNIRLITVLCTFRKRLKYLIEDPKNKIERYSCRRRDLRDEQRFNKKQRRARSDIYIYVYVRMKGQ